MRESGYKILYQCNAVIPPHKVGDGLVDMKCGNLQCHPGICSRCGSSSSIGVFVKKDTDTRKDTNSHNRKRITPAHKGQVTTPSTTKQ